MTVRKIYVGLLAAGVSAVALTGCEHPNAMPTGYTYHGETYKSPAPPPSKRITAEQRKYMDSAQAEQFRDAVYELLQRLSIRAGMPPKPVYILAPDPMTPFYANIDNDLREAMRHVGYAISDMPTGAYVFAYDAKLLDVPRDQISRGYANVELTLKVFDKVGVDARLLTAESGNYYIQGAEVLHIRPSEYETLLPTRETLMYQEDGFVPATEARTATQELPRAEQTRAKPEKVRESMLGYDTPATRIGGPTQATQIDSTHNVNKAPLSPRAPVSREIDY